MAAAGRERGYAYMAIADHVTAERLWQRIEEVRDWNKGKRGFRLLAGSEINIGLDGGLDYPDDLVAALDWVVASVHTSFSIPAAARSGTMLEINGNPNRRDLSEHHARLAREAGVPIVLNTDAHGVDTLDNMAYAVATARRAWLTADDVANTREWREFKRLLK